MKENNQFNLSKFEMAINKKLSAVMKTASILGGFLQKSVIHLQELAVAHRESIESFFGFVEEFNQVMIEDEKVKQYSENPMFWKNVRIASKQAVTLIPGNLSEKAMDYLCEKPFDVKEFKGLLEQPNITELRQKLIEPEFENYVFKDYLLDIIASYETNPESYKIYIPALFMIIEGSLGEVFDVSKKGTASEIKRKMAVSWDVHQYVYSNQFFGSSSTFWMQLFLTNSMELFKEITASSNGQGFVLNRNKILHGKSNPAEWTQEHFSDLISLVNSVLFARRTKGSITPAFFNVIEEEKYERFPLTFTELEKGIKYEENARKSKDDQKKYIQDTKRNLSRDLKHLFGFNDKEVQKIIRKSSFSDIIAKLESGKVPRTQVEVEKVRRGKKWRKKQLHKPKRRWKVKGKIQ